MSKKDADVYVILRYNGQSTVMNNAVTRKCTLDMFKREIVFLCKFTESQLFTIKWVDNDGDSITIYDDIDFEEAFRACVHDKMNILKFLVFDGIPLNPGDLCPYEKQHMHRRNAHRKTKRYFWIGHTFHGVRFSPNTRCKICNDRIWGLGYSGVYCENCPIRVHKNCYKKVTIECHVYKKLMNGHQDYKQSPKELIDDLQTEKPSLDGDNLLAQFELIRVIGRGSYAKVMLVEHKPTKKAYAMKIIKKESLREPEDLNWLHTEKHVFEIATNHAFLVGLHSCFQNSSRLFFVIELVSGGDFMFHMQRQHSLEESHARFYAAEIVIALNFLHSRRIIYRDLKLDNVLLDSEGHIKLTDYGMCKENLLENEKTGTLCGTPNYIAPEIIREEEYDYCVDWWSLGVFMFEMMSGRSPFVSVNCDPEQQTEEHLFHAIVHKQLRIPRKLSVRAGSILQQFLEKNPINRLGYGPPNQALKDIQEHRFFANLDWKLLENKQIEPPFKPTIHSDRDVEYFDQTFLMEDPNLTPDDQSLIDDIDQSEFDGFEYINPFLMSGNDAV